jgi:alpha-beta hydrolase superfamily lysophospholipase
MAEAFLAAGIHFYALDLRKYGRSLRPHQTANLCRSLDEYFEELDEAVRRVRADGQRLPLAGHFTGGLIASLYADARQSHRLVDGLFLNSPFFDIIAGWMARRMLLPVVEQIGRADPARVVPMKLSPRYGESLHASRRGEWDYRLD